MCGQTSTWKCFEVDRVRSDRHGGQYQHLLLTPLGTVVAVAPNGGNGHVRNDLTAASESRCFAYLGEIERSAWCYARPA